MEEITRILEAVESGDTQTADCLLPLAYDELRRMAANKMKAERAGHTLQPTALVHEVYLRLLNPDGSQPQWNSRGHFFVTSVETTAFNSCRWASVTLGNGITEILNSMFANCSNLTTVFVSNSVEVIFGPFRLWWGTPIIPSPFAGCTSLTNMIFLGDAPELSFPENMFADTSPNFTIYHLSSSTGFTSPTWHGYSTVMLDEFTYTAETSTDLHTWVTDGVILSGLGANNHRTASVNLDSPQRFLRLVGTRSP